MSRSAKAAWEPFAGAPDDRACFCDRAPSRLVRTKPWSLLVAALSHVAERRDLDPGSVAPSGTWGMSFAPVVMRVFFPT